MTESKIPEQLLRNLHYGEHYQVYLTNEVNPETGAVETWPMVQDVSGDVFVYREPKPEFLAERRYYQRAVAAMIGADEDQLDEVGAFADGAGFVNQAVLRQSGLYYQTGEFGEVKAHPLTRGESFVMSTAHNPVFSDYGHTPFSYFRVEDRDVARLAKEYKTPVWVSMCLGNADRLGRACFLPLSSAPSDAARRSAFLVPVIVNASFSLSYGDYPVELYVPTDEAVYSVVKGYLSYQPGKIVEADTILKKLEAQIEIAS